MQRKEGKRGKEDKGQGKESWGASVMYVFILFIILSKCAE